MAKYPYAFNFISKEGLVFVAKIFPFLLIFCNMFKASEN